VWQSAEDLATFVTAVMGSTISEARQAERSIGNGDVAQVRSQTRP